MMLEPTISTHAVFDEAGALLFLAPAALCPADRGVVALPYGFADWSHRWDSELRDFVPRLDAMRQRRWEAVRARRDEVEWSGCATQLGSVDSDPDSQRKISGAVQMAMLAEQAGQPFAIDWTMQDNSSVSHDAGAMISMGLAVGQHIAACHAAAVAKRAEIDAADSEAAIMAVKIEEGWPDV